MSRIGARSINRVHYDVAGRVTAALVADLFDAPDARYHLCGPTRFMADVQDGLEAQGVAPERIHTDSFGAPAWRLGRRPPSGAPRPEMPRTQPGARSGSSPPDRP